MQEVPVRHEVLDEPVRQNEGARCEGNREEARQFLPRVDDLNNKVIEDDELQGLREEGLEAHREVSGIEE